MNKVRVKEIVSDCIRVSEYGSEIHWDIVSRENKSQSIMVEVICGMCHKPHWVYKASIRASVRKQVTFTGLCLDCYGKIAKPPRNRANLPGIDNPSAKMGRTITDEGYISINLSCLSSDEQKLALPMSQSGGSKYNLRRVLEHRFVMAKIVGRPLERYEIVHHRNGDRLDNSPENLELLSRAKHPSAHSDEQLSEIQKLGLKNQKSELEIQRLYAIIKEHSISF